ncbi:complex I NDUFA9 subunit family protein [Aurantiacibacter xanthus]|uniref:Complex I NDUFA9 subunit family protein n=1 Tax=Aurantiacibacter xanthus TaxID=1784712 RepID=A0A3A1P0X4_9SPHN|nr:complex I NDUFA9 subunit family protein [Aurantiacibacter xanthus]RIV81114.1 complex I NDUFA9 subunit family protein [Aurantiacibacter xanthus]
MANYGPLEDKLVVLIGGSGFIGRQVAQDLLERGARLRIAARNPEKAFSLKPLANLGQIQFARCNAADKASVEACVAGADAVVYLVGTFGKNQRALQATGAGVAAAAAAANGAQSFVYVSAIGADATSKTGYFRTKGEGEQLVREAFPQATILRPSAVFGEDGGFVPLFADLAQSLPVLPVFGAESKLQPVWVADLAEAIGNALAAPATHGGKTYEIAGPDQLSMEEINRAIAKGQQRDPIVFAVPDTLARLAAALPLAPINRDQLTMLEKGSVASGALPGIDALGVTAKPLSLFLDKWMTRYRKHGRFTAERKPA